MTEGRSTRPVSAFRRYLDSVEQEVHRAGRDGDRERVSWCQGVADGLRQVQCGTVEHRLLREIATQARRWLKMMKGKGVEGRVEETQTP